jgi:Cu/Zn superoxide dismutase
MKGLRSLVLLAVLAVVAVSVADAADHHVTATLSPVGGSGISGTVELTQVAHGTQIVVRAEGLTPGTQYVSLYYDNGTCELEPYSPEDVIEEYTANAAGRAVATGKADDDLDEINSVSVRLKSDFSLQACAGVTH